MTIVSRFEADLLRILHALLGRAPIDGVIDLLVGRRERPPCLGAGAARLIEDTLAKGCVHAIATRGGWSSARHLRGNRMVSGRLWERDEPEAIALEFSGASLGFLIWLIADYPEDEASAWNPPEATLKDGDRVFLFLAREALATTDVPKTLDKKSSISRNGLVRLSDPEAFDEKETPAPDFGPWMGGAGGAVAEALQYWLSRRWVEIERRKARLNTRKRMRSLGAEQDRVLGGWLSACESAGRPDLARFLLVAGATLLRDPPPARFWIAGLDLRELRVAERAEVHRAAGAFLRSFERLRRWERDARTVGFLDEDYATSQLWKSDWESLGGESTTEAARLILRALDPFNLANPSTSGLT